jgi:hypothetical protein
VTKEELERQSLRRIRQLYGTFIQEAAQLWKHRPEVLAGIMQRETEGGMSPLLDKPGPGGHGDRGHGHGLLQIDDRSFPEFCASEAWGDPRENILFGARVLAGKRRFLKSKTLGFGLTDDDIERASIAAYNAGEGNVLKAIQKKEDVDTCTAHKNYSADVLRLAEIYREEG